MGGPSELSCVTCVDTCVFVCIHVCLCICLFVVVVFVCVIQDKACEAVDYEVHSTDSSSEEEEEEEDEEDEEIRRKQRAVMEKDKVGHKPLMCVSWWLNIHGCDRIWEDKLVCEEKYCSVSLDVD